MSEKDKKDTSHKWHRCWVCAISGLSDGVQGLYQCTLVRDFTIPQHCQQMLQSGCYNACYWEGNKAISQYFVLAIPVRRSFLYSFFFSCPFKKKTFQLQYLCFLLSEFLVQSLAHWFLNWFIFLYQFVGILYAYT